MSDLVSALPGARYAGLATIEEAGLQGMITLRGDLSSKTLQKAVKAATGAAVPQTRRISTSDTGAVAWMSPDELLLLVPYAEVAEKTATLEEALSGEHALAVNVSDARALFTLSGAGAREVLGKVCPVDFDPAAFTPGDFRRTRMAQVAAAFWMGEEETFHIVCFRSVAQYVFNLLKTSAHPQAKVGVY
jgi:sarcosine oxidase subunit gamma